jgi:hypothetical protein
MKLLFFRGSYGKITLNRTGVMLTVAQNKESRSKTTGFLTQICDHKMRLNYQLAINADFYFFCPIYKHSIFQK